MTDFFKFRQAIQEKSNRLDPVDDTELDKKFKKRDDKDIDNDGDVDDTDEYLHKRRKAIDKAMDKESGKSAKKKQKQTNEAFINEASTKELKDLDLGDDVMVNGKMGMFYGMQGSKVKVRFPSGQETVPAKDVEVMNLMMDDLEKDDDDPCWDGYVQVGTKMKNGKEVPKCVPMEEAKKHMKEEFSKILSESDDVKFQAWYKKKQELEKMQDDASKALNKFPKGDMGLTPRSVKKTSAFKKAEADYNAIAKALGKHNKSAPKKWLKMASDIHRKQKYGQKTESSKTLGEAYDGSDYGLEAAAHMAMTQLHFIRYAAEEVMDCLESGVEMPEWYQNKISKVHGDMEGIHSYMEGKKRYREMYDMPTEYVYDMDDGEDDMDAMDNVDDDDVMDDQMMAMGMYEAKSVKEGTGKISSFKDDREKSSAADLAKKAGLKVKDTGDGIELSGNMKKISDVMTTAQNRGAKVEESTQISEKLSATDDISDWIKDFKDSDAPQFQGKSEEERKDMAIAAYYDARDKAGYDTPQQDED